MRACAALPCLSATEASHVGAAMMVSKLEQSCLKVGRIGTIWTEHLHSDMYTSCAGKPHLSFGIQNLTLVLLGAAVMLYMKKPIHVSRKETGGFSLGLPITGFKGQTFALQERVRPDVVCWTV